MKSEIHMLPLDMQSFNALQSYCSTPVNFFAGAVVSASLGENLAEAGVKNGSSDFNHFNLHARGANSSISADTFASVSLSAQHGNFQRLFLDLTRFYARMDFPSGSKFISGASHLANDLHSSQTPNMDAVQAIFPSATLSFQQQVSFVMLKLANLNEIKMQWDGFMIIWI